jgi:hypothetical protein
MPIVKALSQKQLALKLKPYAAELGNVVYAWNRLQEAFAFVLWWTLERPPNNVVGAIWHSIPSDSQQRRTLRAAIEGTPSRSWQGREFAQKDFLWALAIADELAARRNDAIHSPYFMMIDADGARLSPNVGLGNKRAMNLMGKELLKEFSECAEDASLLWRFTISVHEALLWPERPWPDRPIRLLSAPYSNPKKLRR